MVSEVPEDFQCCFFIPLSMELDVGVWCDWQLDKVYSRDNMQRGRVRVQLKREDKSLVNPAVPSRKLLPSKSDGLNG
jgi:hypothetical protein